MSKLRSEQINKIFAAFMDDLKVSVFFSPEMKILFMNIEEAIGK
jgi:hypothetical protein